MNQNSIDIAIEQMNGGRWSNASEILEGLVRANPSHARALRLLGTVRYCTGDLDEAAALLESSVRSDARVSDTHSNLATVYLALGRKASALEAAERAVALDAQSVDAEFNLGVAMQANERFQEAERHYERALELDGQCVDARVNLAALLLRRGRPRACIEQAALALVMDDTLCQAHLCKTRAHLQLGEIQEAKRHVDAAERLRPGDLAVAAERGGYLATSGRLEEAVRCLREVISADPGSTDAWVDLGKALNELGRVDEVVESLSPAIAEHPDSVDLHTVLSYALEETGREDEALASLARAVELAPGSAEIHQMHGFALLKRRAFEEADAAFRRAVSHAPHVAKSHLGRVQVKMALEDYTGALRICDEYLTVQPAERSLLAAKAMVLNELGEGAAANELVDLDEFVRAREIETPDAFDDLRQFNQALAGHIRAHPSLAESPTSHATRNGRHTGIMPVEPEEPLAHFERALWRAVHEYLAALAPRNDHVYLRHRPQFDRIVCWGVLMRRQGHQIAHIHPAAWLSGVYYVELPRVIDHDGSVEGWIEFGAPPEDYHLLRAGSLRLIKPEEGLLVLFPSYFYHRTVPYHSDEERLSIAFDVLPQTMDQGLM